MRKSIIAIVCAVAFAAALGLAGCSSSSSSSAASVSTSAASSASASSSAASASASASSASASAAASSASANSSAAAASSVAASSSASSTSEASEEAEAKAEYEQACAYYDEGRYYSAKVFFEVSRYDDWQQRIMDCIQPKPETGEIWHNPDMYSDTMSLSFVVEDADADMSRYIEVYTQENELVEVVFINGPDSVETWLPGGNYYIKEAQGKVWYGLKELYGYDGTYSRMIFDEVDGDRYLTVLDDGYAWEIVINTTSNEGQGIGTEYEAWDSWV